MSLVTTVKLLGKLSICDSTECKSQGLRGSKTFMKLQPEINMMVFWLKPRGIIAFGYFYWYDIMHANEYTVVCAEYLLEGTHRAFFLSQRPLFMHNATFMLLNMFYKYSNIGAAFLIRW